MKFKIATKRNRLKNRQGCNTERQFFRTKNLNRNINGKNKFDLTAEIDFINFNLQSAPSES